MVFVVGSIASVAKMGERLKEQNAVTAAAVAASPTSIPTQHSPISESLAVSLTEKEAKTSDFSEPYLVCQFLAVNHSLKRISGFKGVMTLKDMFGDVLVHFTIKQDDGINPGSSKQFAQSFECNQFISDQMKARDTDLSKLKAEWEPESILFDDGTSLKADQQ